MKVKYMLINKKKGSDIILRTFTPFYQKYSSNMEKFFFNYL